MSQGQRLAKKLNSFRQALRLFLRQHHDEAFEFHKVAQILEDCLALMRDAAVTGGAFVGRSVRGTSDRWKTSKGHREIDKRLPSDSRRCEAASAQWQPGAEAVKKSVMAIVGHTSCRVTVARIDFSTDPRDFAFLDDGWPHTSLHRPHAHGVADRGLGVAAAGRRDRTLQ